MCNNHSTYTENCLQCDYNIVNRLSLINSEMSITGLMYILRENIGGNPLTIDREELDRINGRISIIDMAEKIINNHQGVVVTDDHWWFYDDFIKTYDMHIKALGGLSKNLQHHSMKLHNNYMEYRHMSQNLETLIHIQDFLDHLRKNFGGKMFPNNEICSLLFEKIE